MKPKLQHTETYQDINAIAPSNLRRQAPRRRGSASDLMAAIDGVDTLGGPTRLKACQESENQAAEVVIVCEPEGTSLMMGGLHPRASLYERPVNLDAAKKAHTEFRRVMREAGVRVLTVRDILSYAVEDHMGARVELEELAMRALVYCLAPGFKMQDIAEPDRYYLSDEYKREVLEHMSIAQLIDTLMINPTVQLSPSYRDTGLTAAYTFEPLSNLVYTRDQQITTCRGIVMGRLRSAQRQLEVDLLRFCFDKLGLPVIGEIDGEGYLEGGDFFPLGEELAMVGIGLRSNMEACQQLMDRDLLGTRRFAVVKDDFEQHQDRMHLDCVFNVLGDNVCLMLEEMMGMNSQTRRMVDEYVRDDHRGGYTLARSDVEFSRYMEENGYEIIRISAEDQLLYGCNVLNLGNGRIISVHAGTARQIVRCKHFKGEVQVIDFAPITSMYGAVHCSSQVVRRTPGRQVTTRRALSTAGSQDFPVGSYGKSAPVPIRSPYGSSRNIYSFSPAGEGLLDNVMEGRVLNSVP